MIPGALQLVDALQIIAIITTNFSFIVLNSKVSFNQYHALVQQKNPDWPWNFTNIATHPPLSQTNYLYGICNDIIETGFTFV